MGLRWGWVGLVFAALTGMGMAAPLPPDAAVMATPDQVAEVAEWVADAFGLPPAPRGPRCELTVVRQDHSVLRFGASCIDTPPRLGERTYEHALGTHANSRIDVRVPAGAVRFRADVGVDRNDDTAGLRGSVWFAVRAGETELARTPTLTSADPAHPLAIALPPGTEQLSLIVDATDDGAGWDQADWCDARFELADGTALYLDDHQVDLLPAAESRPPISFVYDGRPSAELLPAWPREVVSTDGADQTEHTITWRDPATGLEVIVEVTVWKQFPAVAWVPRFRHGGEADSPILEAVQAVDVGLRCGYARRPLRVHRLEGDACGAQSFLPATTDVSAGQAYTMAPTGGRPSSISAVPFFNVEYADLGMIVALGWTGQWSATLDRAEVGPGRLRAGQQETHLRLHPGEAIRGPRVMLMPWRGDRQAAHNRFRRLLLLHWVPQRDGEPLPLPVALQCFDRYVGRRPEWSTEAGQIAAARQAAELGCDHLWFDAAWFPGGFPNGVGNWYPDPAKFPRGLGPVGAECDRLGLKFIVWFEPERVAAGSRIATEHPEFVHGGAGGGLFRLDDPAARAWLTDRLSEQVSAGGIDVYRNDFNIDPLGFWRANDADDRRGMTEIRYVEGLYAMWDELLARHPGLWIDNCAGGGRRIDLETIARSVPLWRSDTSCSPGHADWNQGQVCGLAQYVPLQTACAWTPEAFDTRSAATGGLIVQFDYQAEGFPLDRAKALIAEARANAPYWRGDFQPLLGATTSADHWAAYQLHREDLDAGLIYAFRRADSVYPMVELRPRGLGRERRYRVEQVAEDGSVTVRALTGAELDGLELRLPRGESALLRYRAE